MGSTYKNFIKNLNKIKKIKRTIFVQQMSWSFSNLNKNIAYNVSEIIWRIICNILLFL